MRVIDYINQTSWDDFFSAYSAAYDDPPSREMWDRFKEELNARVLVQRDDGMSVLLRYVFEEWSKEPGCGEDQEYIDVGGRDREASNWSLSFTDWSDWKGMEVIDETGKALTPDQIAAHLFYEMTWHGFPEYMEAAKAQVMDSVEEITRAIDAGTLDDLVSPVPFVFE